MADGLRFPGVATQVPGVAGVFHAHMTDHIYPMHAHGSWTLLIIDADMVRRAVQQICLVSRPGG